MKPTPNTREDEIKLELESNISKQDVTTIINQMNKAIDLAFDKGFKQGQEQERKRCLEIIEKYKKDYCKRFVRNLVLDNGLSELKQQIEDTK
jgi:hypothetical protein